MSEILFGLFLLLLLGVRGTQFWRTITRNRQTLRAWQETAGACGLQVVETSSWSPRLSARTESLAVTLTGQSTADGGDIQIDIRIPGPPEFHSVSIRRKPLLRGARKIQVGDPRIDGTFFLEGPMRAVLALLGAETRRLLIQANAEGRLQIFAGGTLRLEGLSNEKIPRVLPLLLHIAQRLAYPMDAVRRLAKYANQDPEPGVRLQNLLLLIRELPEAPETLAALRTACSDASPEIRLRAAQALGAERRDILFELAESLEDDAVSAEAVSTLGGELPFERTKAILDQAQDRSLPKTAHACLEALGEKGASPGQLSLDGAEAGQLSLAHSEAGQLSLATDPAGQLSLPPREGQA